MDERTPPLATFPGPPKQRKPKPAAPQRPNGIGLILLGLALGGLLVFAGTRLAGEPKERIVYRSSPDSAQPDRSTPLKPADNTQAATASGIAEKQPDPKNSIPPYNPFEGGMPSAMPGSEISGQIASTPPAPQPNHTAPRTTSAPQAKPEPPVEEASPRGLLVTVRLAVGDPNQALKEVQGVAAKVGGSAIQFDERASTPDAEGAILLVPAAKADEAEKLLAGVGTVVVNDSWTGGSGARIDRIELDAQARLSDLRIKRQELLVKYFDDAPQIRHLDEDTERIMKCLGALRAKRPGLDTAVIKIRFLI